MKVFKYHKIMQVTHISEKPLIKFLAHLLSLLQQQFQLLISSFADYLVPLGLVLPLGVVLVNTQVQCHIHQCCHQLHGYKEQNQKKKLIDAPLFLSQIFSSY